MTEAVDDPKHYRLFPDGTNAIDVIRAALTPEEFQGYCKGNALKYRLRAGKKDSLEQDIAKANRYVDLMSEKPTMAPTMAETYDEWMLTQVEKKQKPWPCYGTPSKTVKMEWGPAKAPENKTAEVLHSPDRPTPVQSVPLHNICRYERMVADKARWAWGCTTCTDDACIDSNA